MDEGTKEVRQGEADCHPRRPMMHNEMGQKKTWAEGSTKWKKMIECNQQVAKMPTTQKICVEAMATEGEECLVQGRNDTKHKV